MISSTVKSPLLIVFTTPAFTLGGSMTRWTMLVSWTSPRIAPGSTLSPAFTTGLNVHFFSWESPGA